MHLLHNTLSYRQYFSIKFMYQNYTQQKSSQQKTTFIPSHKQNTGKICIPKFAQQNTGVAAVQDAATRKLYSCISLTVTTTASDSRSRSLAVFRSNDPSNDTVDPLPHLT